VQSAASVPSNSVRPFSVPCSSINRATRNQPAVALALAAADFQQGEMLAYGSQIMAAINFVKRKIEKAPDISVDAQKYSQVLEEKSYHFLVAWSSLV
jgi:hypothetical protein